MDTTAVLKKVDRKTLLLPGTEPTIYSIIIKIGEGLDRPRGFQKVKAPRFLDNGTG